MFFFNVTCLSDLIDGQQRDLDKFFDWCLYNKLSLNIDKTKTQVFSCKKLQPMLPRPLCIDNVPLSKVDSFKYLGILLDNKLSFRMHYNAFMQRLQNKMYLLNRIWRYINSFTALLIYKSHILSYLEYGSVFMDCIPLTLKQKLQRCQNRCLRIALKTDKYTSNFTIHKRSKVLPLKYRRRMGICKLMHHNMYKANGLFYEHSDNISASSHKVETRSNRLVNMKVPHPKTETFKRSFVYQGPHIWNQLPNLLKNCKDGNMFKKLLKKFMYLNFWEDGFV